MFYIYHHTDADGYASAATVITYLILTKKILNWQDNRIKLISYNYEKLDSFVPLKGIKFEENDEVFIVDLSVSTATLAKFILFIEMLYKKKCKLTWIDHHKSSTDFSFDDLLTNRFDSFGFEKYINTDYCAAYNAFHYLIQQNYSQINFPEILRVVDDYDCWKLKLNGTKEFNVGFSLYDRYLPTNPDWYDWLLDRSKSLSIIKECIEDGTTINEWLRIDDTNKFNMGMFETKLCGLSCCALNVRRNSDIFRTTKEYDVLLSYIYDGESYKYSIYSKNKDVDCSRIAEMFGGGGHRGASGFITHKLVVSKKMSLLYRIKDMWRSRKYKNKLKE